MIHGIYVRNSPKGLWYLMTIAKSAELAKQDKITLLQEAIKNGNENAESKIQTFDSVLLIPASLKEIKEDSKILYN